MNEANSERQQFSKEGIATISLIALSPVIYALSPPFLVKVMRLSGSSFEQVVNATNVIYYPIIYLIEKDLLFSGWLTVYYQLMNRWLGLP